MDDIPDPDSVYKKIKEIVGGEKFLKEDAIFLSSFSLESVMRWESVPRKSVIDIAREIARLIEELLPTRKN